MGLTLLRRVIDLIENESRANGVIGAMKFDKNTYLQSKFI